MFVRTNNAKRAFNLDSVVCIEPAGSTPNLVIQARLIDGSTVGIDSYATDAEAQEAFDFLMEKVGFITPPVAVT